MNASRPHPLQHFDPMTVIRVCSGLLYVPHVLYKLLRLDGSAAFFAKAGFQPPMAFLVLALIMETVCALGLTFNILTKWVGLISASVLAVAAYAVIATKGLGWFWNLGGVEYLFVWAGLSVLLALDAWKRELGSYGRAFLLFPKAA